MRKSIPPKERLAITLRYLASGCSFTDLHYIYRCGRTTAAEVVKEVCVNIWIILKEKCIPTLTQEDWLHISDEFKQNANFPNCLGALDGKHIRMKQPSDTGSLSYNYKNFFSIVLFASCDANYRFTFVDVGSYGKCSDSSIFKNSEFYKRLQNNTLNVPNSKPICSNGEAMPYVFVGDEAFGISDHVQCPYGGKNLNLKEKMFNYRLSRARRYIECTFGILSNKWRIFHRPIDVSCDFAEILVKSCCVLHNFVHERDGHNFEETLRIVGFEDTNDVINIGPGRATAVRDKFATYFVSEEEATPWQNNMI
ncbi:protein ALP1-like isoform X2 [Penaeus japonicus]|nr:protein ALP1-like isoform X2 [Penaeus japonicus]